MCILPANTLLKIVKLTLDPAAVCKTGCVKLCEAPEVIDHSGKWN